MRINDKEKILAHIDENNLEDALYYNQFILPFSIDVKYTANSEKEKYIKENNILDNFANKELFKKGDEVISDQLEDYFFKNYFELYDIRHKTFDDDNEIDQTSEIDCMKNEKRASLARIFNYTNLKIGEKIGEYVYTSKSEETMGLKLNLDVADLELRVLKIKSGNYKKEKRNYKMSVLILVTLSCYKGIITDKEMSNFNKIKSSLEEKEKEKKTEENIRGEYIKFVGDKFKKLYDDSGSKERYSLALTLTNSKNSIINFKNTLPPGEERTTSRKNEMVEELMKLVNKDIEFYSNRRESFNLLNVKRMFSNCSIQDTKIDISNIDYFNLDTEIPLKLETFEELICYTNLDYNYPTIQNNVAIKGFIDKSVYLRWSNLGSLYVCSPISAVFISKGRTKDFLIANQHTVYYELYLLVLTQSLLLNIFHDELLGAKNSVNELGDTVDAFLEDANRWLIFKLSGEIQAIELYELYQDGLGIDKLYDKLLQEVSYVQMALGNKETKQVNATVDTLTNRANAIAYISLVIALFTLVISLPSQYATTTGEELMRVKYLNFNVPLMVRAVVLLIFFAGLWISIYYWIKARTKKEKELNPDLKL